MFRYSQIVIERKHLMEEQEYIENINSNSHNTIISKIMNEVEKNLKYIGKIDKNKLSKYASKIIIEDVIITDERLAHIKEHHPELEDKEIKSAEEVLKSPDYIFEDRKNKDTLLMVKRLKLNKKNYRMVVKLNTSIDIEDKFNSVISFWHISEKKLGQYIRNEKIIYENLDK